MQLIAKILLVCSLANAQELFVGGYAGHNVVRFNGATGAPVGVFAGGGGLANPGGIAFGPDGHLYVASTLTDQILKYNGQTGAFVGVFASGGPLIGSGPFGLEFGPDANLYVSTLLTSQVLRFDGSSGGFIDIFASSGGLSGATGIAFGPEGDLYVGSANSDEVLRFDGLTGAAEGPFASGGGLVHPIGIVFGPDGNLYVATEDGNQVLRYDGSSGAFIDVFASAGLSAPQGLVFGPDGHLYVASRDSNQVTRHDGTTGALLGVFASGGGLDRPGFLVFRETSPAAEPGGSDSPFQVRYVANLNVADSLINITNTGANGAMPFGPGIGPPAGNLCVNVYAFSPDEQMVACCSCHVTPNGLVSLSVYNDIRAATLTGLTPNSMAIKLVATATGGSLPPDGGLPQLSLVAGPIFSGGASSCIQSAAGLNVTHPVTGAGVAAWATTAHVPGALPVPGAPTPFAITETPFVPATLSPAAITSLNNRCTAILGNGSTFGTCRSCTVGGRGARKY